MNLQACLNNESRFYSAGINPLTSEQKMRGCEKIKYNGNKIKVDFFRQIPKESILRTLPVERVLKDFSGSAYLDPEITLEDAIKEYEKSLKPLRHDDS
jgi:hypothetical protein